MIVGGDLFSFESVWFIGRGLSFERWVGVFGVLVSSILDFFFRYFISFLERFLFFS